MNKHSRIAITGGIGFIGANLCKYLNKLGYENIHLFDNIENNDVLSSRWKNLSDLYYAGIYSYDKIGDFISTSQSYDAIFHLGANSSTTTQKEQYTSVWHNNYIFSRLLIQQASINFGCKIIFASSAATYGASNDFTERIDNLYPLNFYGATKLAIDKFISNGGIGYNTGNVYSLRFFNVFGPKEDHKAGMISGVSRFWKMVKSGDTTVDLFKSYRSEFANGEQARDFVSVQDVCKVMVHCALLKDAKGGIYNVGSGKATTWNQMVKDIAAVQNKSVSVNYIDMPEGEFRDQYQYYTCADLTKLRNQLGYKDEFLTIKQALTNGFI